MKLLYKTVLLVIILAASSCATIVSGSRQMVQIKSNPADATVYINEIEIGKTPVQENLKRNQEYQLALKLEGFEPYETKLEKKFNAWYIGNIGFGGLIGIIVDPITGAIYKLQPEEVDGKLKPGTTYEMDGGNLFIDIQMNAEPTAEKIGQLEPVKK